MSAHGQEPEQEPETGQAGTPRPDVEPRDGQQQVVDPRGTERAVIASSERVAETDRAASAPLVPVLAAEDTPRSWGDDPDDHDAWLLEQRPPHWG